MVSSILERRIFCSVWCDSFKICPLVKFGCNCIISFKNVLEKFISFGILCHILGSYQKLTNIVYFHVKICGYFKTKKNFESNYFEKLAIPNMTFGNMTHPNFFLKAHLWLVMTKGTFCASQRPLAFTILGLSTLLLLHFLYISPSLNCHSVNKYVIIIWSLPGLYILAWFCLK